ncbi:MAG: GNAT family N-acetyltransferase [Pseudomonadota bacterium]
MAKLRMKDGYTVQAVDIAEARSIVVNLAQLYLHDMAEWFRFDQREDGRYGDMTEYLMAGEEDVYLLYAAEIPVGFGIVGSADQWLPATVNGHDMDEFFVVRRHRRAGVGAAFAQDLWERYPGPWLVRVFQPNLPAIPFWRNTISRYSQGAFEEVVHEKNGFPWSHFSFDVVT